MKHAALLACGLVTAWMLLACDHTPVAELTNTQAEGKTSDTANKVKVVFEELAPYGSEVEIELKSVRARVSQDKRHVNLYLSNIDGLGCSDLPDLLQLDQDNNAAKVSARIKSERDFLFGVLLPNQPPLSPRKIDKPSVVFVNRHGWYLLIGLGGSITVKSVGEDRITGTLALDGRGPSWRGEKIALAGEFSATVCR